jgi:hemoglobin
VPPTLYESIGGEKPLRALVDRFYDLMATMPEAAGVRELHPEDLAGSREKLFQFLSGWSGGPELYRQAHGHPKLRARHMPFPIGTSERNQWLLCMLRAIEAEGLSKELRIELMQAFTQIADFMRNVEE